MLFQLTQVAYSQYEIMQQSNEWVPLNDVTIEGNIFLRMPGALEYDWFPSNTKIPEHTLGYVAPDSNNPLATDSYITIGSHSIIVYPSATFRLAKTGIIPLSGRFEFNSQEGKQFITINTRKAVGEYRSGNLLIEVTPESGIFIAMRGKGDAWFKDNFLTIHEFKNDAEICCPPYAKTIVSRRVSSIWNNPPQTFGNLASY